MADRIYEGETVVIEVTWKDKDQIDTDPGSCTITIYDPDEVVKVDGVAMAKIAGTESTYTYDYDLPATAVPAGKRAVHYKVMTEATIEGRTARGVGHFVVRSVV